LLTPAPDASSSWKLVKRNGQREDIALTHEAAKSYAEAAAKGFVVGESKAGDKAVKFDKNAAKNDAAEGNKKAAAKKTAAKKITDKKAGTESTEEPTAEE
jgi:hypothetical protein